MSSKHDSISEITPEKECWTIVAKVIRLWKVSNFSKPDVPFSLEMVLMDDKGDKIHGSIRRTLIYKFDKLLKEGIVYSIHNFGVAVNGGNYRTCHHMYKINFQFQTKVQNNDSLVRGSIYTFVPIPEIVSGSYDMDYLVDVMGMLTGVGTEREYEKDGKKTKLNVIAVDGDGQKIQCTLFGPYCDELSTFIASGEHENAVVIFHLAKVKTFQGKIHLQNCINCTRIIYNAVSEEAISLRNRMNEVLESPTQGLTQLPETGSVGLEADFLQVTQRKTIEALKECNEECSYVVYATVKHVIEDDDWFYTACPCGKSVYPDHKMFFCEKCDNHVIKVETRYRIKVRVVDDTDCATFVIWDRDARVLFRKSCSEMFETQNQNKKSVDGSLPKQISDLVDRSFLFKVGNNCAQSSKWEKNFNVKRICYDEVIVNKFIEMYMKSVDDSCENVHFAAGRQAILNTAENEIAQNLLTKFGTADIDQESQLGEDQRVDLAKDTEYGTSAPKRESSDKKNDVQLEQSTKLAKKDDSDMNRPLIVLKKNIKKEKE